ncbi:hypothetical protein [Mycolicibacterium frederiksbergense]|uniref:Condensation domain-containing protein n=1 Tax=Mycolicibacterium frederiksbergense TaxID=117567 RepID=A0A6H0SDY5_9MYCO|nr:hypothetical protein [Mycolicibacterium frederiksbergense]QIV84781.1 hypothetical protein EXE63_30800 [Mycolicibacterium frederiksbergense]
MIDGHVRVAALDMVHSHRRSAVVVGPLTLPSHDQLTTRLDAMTAAGPLARLCLEPSAAGSRWRRVRESAEPRVYPIAAPKDSATLIDLLQTVRGIDDRAVTLATAGDWLAIDFSHGLGEIPLIHTLLDVLFGITDARDTATWRPYARTRSPLAAAAVATFGANPARLAKLLAAHRTRTATAPPGAETPGHGTAFTPTPATRVIGLDAGQVAELRALRDRCLPGVSMVAVFTCALWSSFERAGIAVDDVVKIPFDVRRFLPGGRDTLASFSAGLDFVIDRAGGPARLHHEMTEAATTGRPVANLLVGTAKARSRSGRGPHALPVPATPKLQLLHSNLGSPQWNGPWPFISAEQACMLVANDPATPTGVTVTSVTVAQNLWFTAEFHRSVFDPDAISTALGLLPQTVTDLLSSG